MTTRDFLDLVRIPNAATALSDVAAAGILARAVTGEGVGITPLVAAALASVLLYLGGMALNDVADADVDARERPNRPIPSGRVGTAEAIAVSIVLLGAGLGAAWFAGQQAFAIALVLLLAIVAYDTSLAGRVIVGPIGMGLCRALNWGLGLAAAGGLGGIALVAILIVFVYVFGLTHLSLGDVGASARGSVVIALLTTIAASLAVVLLARELHLPLSVSHLSAVLLPLALIGLWSLPHLLRALLRPTPAHIGPSVGSLVGGITLLGAAIAGAAASWWALVPFAGLVAVRAVLGRHFRLN